MQGFGIYAPRPGNTKPRRGTAAGNRRGVGETRQLCEDCGAVTGAVSWLVPTTPLYYSSTQYYSQIENVEHCILHLEHSTVKRRGIYITVLQNTVAHTTVQ